MPHVFGPVPSRRLGLSMGIDLIPAKTCTYDCLYCQVGRTTSKILDPQAFVPVGDVIAELEKRLQKSAPDVITLAGSGEPTLYSEIDKLISSIKEITKTDLVLLTNGALLFRHEVRKRVLEADIIMPTLTTTSDKTFKRIHRPHPGLSLDAVLEGLETLRQDFKGRLFLEVVLLAGINDTEKEIEGLKQAIERIDPDKIQLNTVVRPPADQGAISVDRKRLEDIKIYFGEKAEIVAGGPKLGESVEEQSLIRTLLDMAARRPLRSVDISCALNLSMADVESLVKGLLIKGYLRSQEDGGEVYYATCRQ